MPQAIRTPPNTTYYVSRNTRDNKCLLPSHRAQVGDVMLYLLGGVASRLGIKLHVLSILPNRWEMVVTDAEGVLPRLFELVHPSITASLNAVLHRSGPTWESRERLERRILETRAEVLEYSARVLSAPVRAGLVRHGGSYRGVCTRPKSLNDTQRINRLQHTTVPQSTPVPNTLTLRFVCPPQFESAEVFAAELSEAVEVIEEAERQRRTHFATEAQLKALDTNQGIEQLKDLDHAIAKADNAHFEITDTERRDRQNAQQTRWFRKLYRPTWVQFKNGLRDVFFPRATYWMTYIAGCNLTGIPPDPDPVT